MCQVVEDYVKEELRNQMSGIVKTLIAEGISDELIKKYTGCTQEVIDDVQSETV